MQEQQPNDTNTNLFIANWDINYAHELLNYLHDVWVFKFAIKKRGKSMITTKIYMCFI